MKIRIASDLHREFDTMLANDFDFPRIEGEEDMVLILGGDITAEMEMSPQHWDRHSAWIRSLAKRHHAVVQVAGNHEFYHGDMMEVRAWFKRVAEQEDNLHFLDNGSVVIDGVRFIGGTLWTNMDNQNPLASMSIVGVMNDFNYILVNGQYFTAADWLSEHYATVKFIEDTLAEDFDGPTVVVTHHLPSYMSISERFKTGQNRALNHAYASALDNLIWYNAIALWVHGHTHDSKDYEIGDEVDSTRIVCNPRGYAPDMLNPEFNPNLVVEVV